MSTTTITETSLILRLRHAEPTVRERLDELLELLESHASVQDRYALVLREEGLRLLGLLEEESDDQQLLMHVEESMEKLFATVLQDAVEGSPLQSAVIVHGELREAWQVELQKQIGILSQDVESVPHPLANAWILWVRKLPSEKLKVLVAKTYEAEARQDPASYRLLIVSKLALRRFAAFCLVEEESAASQRIRGLLREGEAQVTAELMRLQEMQRGIVERLRGALREATREIGGLRQETHALQGRVSALETGLSHTQQALGHAQAQNAANARAIANSRGGGGGCAVS